MTERDQVLRFLERAKARVEGDDATQPPATDAVQYARDRLEEAIVHAHAGEDIPAGARLRSVKQAVIAGMRPVTSHQRPFNLQLLSAVDGLAAALDQVARATEVQEQRTARVQASLATTDITVDDLVDGVRRLSDVVAGLSEAVGDMRRTVAAAADGAELASMRAELATMRSKQNLIFRTAREALALQGVQVDQLTELSRELTVGYEELYEDLEDAFRGTRNEVTAKLTPYLADVRATPGRGPVIDVGCGRGEWLELLRDAQVEAYGIDVNKVVVDRCVERGLDVRVGDALVHLREIPEESARVITSFHVVEHLSLDTLVGLIDAALVALQPGGALIFETPNPTNVNVGASSFYLDPTHLKPLHPQFLEFLLLSRGFVEVDARYLNPAGGPVLSADDLASPDTIRNQQVVDRINWALSGPLDFGVVARKADAAPSASA
jgi:SAM-dependent methyltransferase